MSMGRTAKMRVCIGNVAVKRNLPPKAEGGLCYVSIKGLHLLCGDEGVNDHSICPYHEEHKYDSLGRKIDLKGK